MTYIPSVQVKTGIEKREHPERFCPKRNCLWRTGGGYCPRHAVQMASPIQKWLQEYKVKADDTAEKVAAELHKQFPHVTLQACLDIVKTFVR